MKLTSKEICPTEVRDKLIEKLAPIDNGINDMRFALETAEEKCFELNKENGELEQYVTHAKNTIIDLKVEIKQAENGLTKIIKKYKF